MQKVKISEGAMNAGLVISNTNDAVELINSELLGRIKDLGIEVTNEVVQDLLKGTNKTEALYLETSEADLKKINNPAIRESMRNTAIGAWGQFEGQLTSIIKDVKGSYQYITVVDGIAVLSPADGERIREQNRRYVTSPQEIKAHEIHLEIAEKLNLLFKGNIPFNWIALFPIDAAGMYSACEMNDYSRFI